MATIRRLEELEIWQLAKELQKMIFELTKTGPLSKDFILKDQLNASAGSIMDNIAEGYGRSGRLEFINFLSIAVGSAIELKSQLYRAMDRGYVSKIIFDDLYERVDMICAKTTRLISYLKKAKEKGWKFKDRK